MASKFMEESDDAQLRPRKGHDKAWSCDKHDEPIKFYCKSHVIPICHPCATKDHSQHACKLEDIEDVILEMKGELEHKSSEIKEAKERLKVQLESLNDSCDTWASSYLQAIEYEVLDTFEKRLRKETEAQGEEIRGINLEADEEIQIINDKRDARIKKCKENGEQREKDIKETRDKNFADVDAIATTVRNSIRDFRIKHTFTTNAVEDITRKITVIQRDDKVMVSQGPQVIASLEEILNVCADWETVDRLAKIKDAVKGIRFIKGDDVTGKGYTRIAGYIGKWELAYSVQLPPSVEDAYLDGMICDNEGATSALNTRGLYVTDFSKGHTEKVIQLTDATCIVSCAPISPDLIVCGKWIDRRNQPSQVHISLYDRRWELVRNIDIPRNTSDWCTWVFVDVDRNGMILAVERYQPNIYVINPDDGRIVDTLTVKGKVCDQLRALSSGDIALQTDANEYTIISHQGIPKASISRDEWAESRCGVDRESNTLFVTYLDEELKSWSVDQVSSDAAIEARRIVSVEKSDRTPYTSPSYVTPSGRLVCCNGDKLFVHKKSFAI